MLLIYPLFQQEQDLVIHKRDAVDASHGTY